MKNKEFYLENDGLKIHCKLDYPDIMQSEEDKCPGAGPLHGRRQAYVKGVKQDGEKINFRK